MALADIDAGATRRRIQEIADAARAAFEAHAQRSADIDAASREAAAKEEADLEAVQERRAELAARAPAEEQPKPARPSTLSLGAEEFKLEREARQAAEQATPAAEEPPAAGEPAPAVPESKEEPRPSKTLKLGARDDEDTPEGDKPVRKRPPRPEADDDLSGRTWLR
jgi:hypothetical protein